MADRAKGSGPERWRDFCTGAFIMRLRPSETSGTIRPSFESVFHSMLPYVLRSTRQLGVPPRDVEDVAQNIMSAVHRRLHTYDPSRPLTPWIKTIAWRAAKDYREQAWNRAETLVDAEGAEIADGALDSEERLRKEEAGRLVVALLESVEPNRRMVLVMHDLDEVTVADIAAALKMSVPKATKMLRLARADLQKAWERYRRRDERALLAAHRAGLHGRRRQNMNTTHDVERVMTTPYEGMRVRHPSSPAVYLVLDGLRRLVPDLDAYSRLFDAWDVHVGAEFDAVPIGPALPRDVAIVRFCTQVGLSTGGCGAALYLRDTQYRWITEWDAMIQYGFTGNHDKWRAEPGLGPSNGELGPPIRPIGRVRVEPVVVPAELVR